MIQSMTGFGKATREINNKKFSVEIRSLNSRQLDLSVRLPSLYREKEVELRNHIAKELKRGKIDISLYFDAAAGDKNHRLNMALATHYYQSLKMLTAQFEEADRPTDMLSVILKMPEILHIEKPEVDPGEWKHITGLIGEAIQAFVGFRNDEGKALEVDILSRINNISNLLEAITPFEKVRIANVRERIRSNMEELGLDDRFDENRFEQELIYYLEKLDINEEKVRLKSHCNLFLQTLAEPDSQGKKLGFISQEIGREINTIGSKANNADIQKLVVQMKDELEKIKEQALNVL